MSRKALNGNTVDPAKILAAAMKAKPHVVPPKTYPLMEYAKAIEVLRQKGWSWDMVHEWFTEKGIEATSKGLQMVSRRWGQTDEYVEWVISCEDKEKELDNV